MTHSQTIAIAGIGKLGLCWALALERAGYSVLGADLSQEYVDQLNSKTLKSVEPEVSARLAAATKFFATTDINRTLSFSSVIFAFVATPSLPNGKYDHAQIERIVSALGSVPVPNRVRYFVIGCTVFPGYCDELQARLASYNVVVVYNPQFIAQGAILRGQEYPDTVLVGCDDVAGLDVVEQIHRTVVKNSPTVARMPLFSAEVMKLSLNCFITTKVAYANMVGDIVSSRGQDPDVVLGAIASDSRVGAKCLKYGFGFGGPCFPRDNRALAVLAGESGLCAAISQATDVANNAHSEVLIQHYRNKYTKDQPIVFDYVTYKPGTNLLVESQPLVIALALAKEGYRVIVRDSPEVVEQLKSEFGDLFIYA